MSRLDYENEDPIDDALVVLDLLCPNFGDATERTLWLPKTRSGYCEEPCVERSLFTSGYTKDCWTHSHRFRVTEGVADRLRERGLVSPTPHWGFTDDGQLRITKAGENEVWERWKSLEAVVCHPCHMLRAATWYAGRFLDG